VGCEAQPPRRAHCDDDQHPKSQSDEEALNRVTKRRASPSDEHRQSETSKGNTDDRMLPEREAGGNAGWELTRARAGW